MVRSERKQEAGIGLVLSQQPHQIGYALSGAAVGIDIDF
jgi:hypothetical protein